MRNKLLFLTLICTVALSCNSPEKPVNTPPETEFKYKVDQFADLQILRYQSKDFEALTPKQKELTYYLYEAGLSGRDIIYDQNFKHNLRVRKTLDGIMNSYIGDRNSDDFRKFTEYTKRVWFSNGIHHHYSTRKIIPEFSSDYFKSLIENSSEDLPLIQGETKEKFIAFIIPVIFDPAIAAKRVNLNGSVDMVKGSANNYYEGVTQREVEAFYKKMIPPNDTTPISYGLNSKIVKENSRLVEKVYKVGGMYSQAIERIVYWLEKASSVSENGQQKAAIDKLIEYYKTGDLKKFDEYNIAWLNDTTSVVDFVNGFIEVYGDPLGLKGAYESVVSVKNGEASQRMAALSQNAQWFEDQSPISPEHKKKNVIGVSYKVITVVSEGGDSAPATAIGINLPNSNWIRKTYGSKSVSLGNITDANANAASKGAVNEFYLGDSVQHRIRDFAIEAGNMHTSLHEVIGHASGQLMPGVRADALKNYSSTLEEARADLVALYYITDPKMVELGVQKSVDIGKAQFDAYISNGLLLQLRRLEEGENLEEAHMRNRQLVSAWVFEKGKGDNVIEKRNVNGKTYFVINDYKKLRKLFGDLLKEVQRIKSTGDFAAGKNLIETYGVKVDQSLVREVKERYKQFDSAPYSGFIQPKLVPVIEHKKIVDVKIEYPDDFVKQMLEYGREYSFLPVYN
jgi:dipeptidyl-peptidase III